MHVSAAEGREDAVTPEGDIHLLSRLDELLAGDLFVDAAAPTGFHPHPVPCRNCGTILQATYAKANGFKCPQCLAPACYTCGCTETSACVLGLVSADGALSTEHVCGWAFPGMCTFCYSTAAYELYMRATGREAADPFETFGGRTAFAFKGLGYGV